MNKKILTCFSIIGVCSLLSLNLGIESNAKGILPSEKPNIINEETDFSGKVDSLMENQADKIDGLTNQEKENNEIIEDKLPEETTDENGDVELMAPDAFLEDTDMTVSDFGNVIISRMLDVVSFFQKFAKPFTIIMFILSALAVIVSMVFGGGKNAKLGFLGMILSVLAYVGTIYAPDIVLFFAQWLSV